MSDEPNITFAYDCTAAEKQEASRILAQQPGQEALGKRRSASGGSAGRGNFLGWILFIGLAVMLFFLVSRNRGSQVPAPAPHPPTPTPVAVGEVLLVAGILLFLVGWWRLRAARLMDERKWDGQMTFTITARGLTQRRPGREEFHGWGRFSQWDESKNIFLLRTQRSLGIVIPKRLFVDDEQCAQFRDLLQQNITRRAIPMAIGFPVIQ
jgi:hypothetical protein